MSLNACLHALGSIEFLLLKNKRSLTGFDGWFVPWKARLRTTDTVMKWVRSARDIIVHQDDLETNSISRVSIVCSYDDAAKRVMESLRPRSAGHVEPGHYEKTLNYPPRMNKQATLRALGASSIPKSILEQASIVSERRWVDKRLPDWELLIAMAYAYAILAELVREAHDLDQISHSVVIREQDDIILVDMSDSEFLRPPCMSSTREERSGEILLATDTEASVLEKTPFDLTDEGAQRAIGKFGFTPSYPPVDPKSALDWVQPVLDVARSIVAAGSEHEWHIMFFQGGAPRQHISVEVSDRSEKRRTAQEVAETCAALGFDGVLSIGEVWQSLVTMMDDGTPVSPGDHPDRNEGLMVNAECADGSQLGFMVLFTRHEDRSVDFGEQREISEGSRYNFFSPVRAVWQQWRS